MDDSDARHAEKRARSEAQRIESLRRRQELDKTRRLQISSTLNADNSEKTKKIVFEDSDSEGEKKSVAKGKMTLFEENESEQEEEGFDITNRHSGPKGVKLMKMEAHFNNDSRFRMDDKFASSDSEQDEANDPSIVERQKNRELLEKVLGKTLRPQPSKQQSNLSNTRPFTRFDPDNKEHVQWMKMFGGAQGKNSDDIDENVSDAMEVTEEDNPEKRRVEGQFFDMSSTFADELKQRLSKTDDVGTDTGFSFLKMMGRESSAASVPAGNTVDTSQFEVKNISNVEKSEQKRLLYTEDASDNFFLTGDEPNVKSVVVNFRRTQPVEKMATKWSSYRDSIEKIYQQIRKNSRKNERSNNTQPIKKNYSRKMKPGAKSTIV